MVPLWYHSKMRPRIHQLVRELEAAGFVNRGGENKHRNYQHPAGINITVRGELEDDAKHYLINDIKKAINLIDNERY